MIIGEAVLLFAHRISNRESDGKTQKISRENMERTFFLTHTHTFFMHANEKFLEILSTLQRLLNVLQREATELEFFPLFLFHPVVGRVLQRFANHSNHKRIPKRHPVLMNNLCIRTHSQYRYDDDECTKKVRMYFPLISGHM